MARILIADDDPGIRALCRRVLERAGYDTEEAADGRAAVESQRQHPADVVLMDILMPTQEGLETIIELRREFPDVKIIAMSGGGLVGPDSYLRVAERLGADRVFEKPFNNDELLAAVDQLLDERI